MTRLHAHKQFDYSPKALRRLRLEKALFISENNKDVYYEFLLEEDIPFISSNILVCSTNKKGKRPWFTNCLAMFFLDLIMLGWIQRLILYYNSFIVHFHLKKLIVK